MKTILVATDASEAAHRAVALAADLAVRFEAELHLLHVVRNMDLPPELAHMAEVEKLQGQRDFVLNFVSEKILNDCRDAAAAQGVARVTTHSRQGDPVDVILATAKDAGAELIVMGTRGLGTVKGALLGSVSRKVSNLADVNLLIVR